ncbi:serine/threonine-protein kinase [Nocardia sp. CDC160]|uniref:serine/threonine-protein kinase n=1 Tax=Nocardia sp. CDC160 TaxID=3112166 RepID=UPI002DBA26AB|nr:serine/threonine-protein kinase [Nocardia sp. CDC160]MEC3916601.1 serine/threonine-protein kinase [Nocardia sp. CDC160]
MLRSGELFAGYEIERELGRGGMGSVYLARHPRLPRLIALKLLSRDVFGDIEVRKRFEREGDLIARLEHPNIVPVYDRGIDDAQPWIAMRYIDGPDASHLEAANLPPRQAIRIIAETARALDFAHRRGVLHRDVKPANILLEYSDDEPRVFLADFGIARLRDDATKLTQTGSFTATLTYASPEQLSGQPLDPRSDQYSLACTLFRLLTGDVPFNAEHPVGIIHGHLNQVPPPVSALRPGLPPSLDAVLVRALAKHPEGRFDSCTAFANAAQQALENPAGPTLVMPNHAVMPNHGPAPQHSSGPRQLPGTAHYTAARPGTAAYTAVAPAAVAPRARPLPVPPPRKKRSKLRGCLLGLAAIVVLPLMAIGGLVAYLDENGTSHTATTTAPLAPTTQDAGPSAVETTDAAADIPEHSGADAQVLSQRFPQMLPQADPNSDSNSGTGYQGAACTTYQRSSPPPDTGSGDPDLGSFAVAWNCAGTVGHPTYRFVMYRSAADAEEALNGLSATRSDVKAHGNLYTNYQLSGSALLRPRLVTEFHSQDGKHAFLMYSTAFLATDDQLLDWWRSAPIN